MATKQKPGSRRGRTTVDWEQAFHYYAQLPATEQTYQAVADHYRVSVRTVEKHGYLKGWKQRLHDVHAEAAALANAKLSEARAAKLSELDQLIDASLMTYAHQLRAGTVKVVPADLQRLFKLREELWAQEAAATTSTRAVIAATAEADEDPAARKLEIVRALSDAGYFTRLQRLLGDSEQAERKSREAVVTS